MKILVTGAWKFNSENIKAIESLGYDVSILQYEDDCPPCDDFDAIICNGFFLYHSIENFRNLKFIHVTSAGTERVPMEYVNSHNIRFFNARGVYSIPMAEYAVSKVLDIYKDSKGFFEKQNKCLWEKNRNLIELYNKTICVVGCGSVGTECAKRFKAFGCNVIGVDNFVTDWFDGTVALDYGLQIADVVILTLPLNDATRGIINKEKINQLKPNTIVINISRGEILENDALLCRDDIVFVLDVFDSEPLEQDNPLWKKENVIITPHNSFVGEHNNERLANLIIKNLESAGRI